jgi:selenocysteine-specific elongation factor
MICATLGHVDHGKTALLRALTGIDADRLPEEKARGMTIDLGFAYRRADAVTTASAVIAANAVIPAKAGIQSCPQSARPLIAFVDVPGHERFIRNLLAGVCAIDMALLVVAADDGVMPQTREHVAIAGLLRIPRIVVVVTKVDRVEAQRVEAVVGQARALLREHGLREDRVFRVSPTRGDGIPALARFLDAQAVASTPRSTAGLVRFTIDRAFAVKGAGTVVTGTVVDGCITNDCELVLSPSGKGVRVRGLRVHDAPVPQACAGERCAIQLAGLSLDEVGRGEWLVSPSLHRPTRRIDLQLRAVAGEALVPHRSQLQLHVGTDAVSARLVALHPAADGMFFATLTADREVCVHRDERFILRDPARQCVVAGGRVLEPFAPMERSTAPGRIERLRALDGASAVQVARDLARATGHVSPGAFGVAWKLDGQQVRSIVAAAGLVMLGPDAAVEPARMAELRGEVHAALAAHHARDPRSAGMPLAELHDVVRGLPASCIDEVVQWLASAGALVVHGGRVRLSAHKPVADAHEEALWRRVRPKLVKAGALPPRVDELAVRLDADAAGLLDLLRRKVGEGELLRLADDRYAARQCVDSVVRLARRVACLQADGRFTAAQFRDALGSGRGTAIEWLEWLDRQRITVRVGDLRRMTARADALAVVPATPAGKKATWRRRHRFGDAPAREGSRGTH